jgi:photosystem II stability/assembly factor-like uncharacterized protein
LTGVSCDITGNVTAIVYSGALLTSKDHGATWKRRDLQPEELHTAQHPEGLAFVKLVRTPRELLVVSLIGVPARGQKLPTRRWSNVLALRGDRVEPWRLAEQLDNEVDTTLDSATTGARSIVVTPSGRAVLVTDSGNYWAASFESTWHRVLPVVHAPTQAQQEQFEDVAGDDRALYAVGSRGSLGISTDAGTSWRSLRSPDDHFRAVWTDGQNALVAGDNITISRDAGKTWSALRQVVGKVQLAGHGAWAAGAEYYVAGDRGLFYSSDAGETFAAVDVGFGPYFRGTGVWGRPAQPVLVVGGVHERSSGIVRSAVVLRAAGGRPELVMSLPWPEDEQESYAPAFTSIHGNQEQRVYAGGRRGLFVRSLDGGNDWQQMPAFSNGQEQLCRLHAGRGDTLWALSSAKRDCHSSQLWVSHDAGQTFALVEPPRPGADVSAIGGSPEGELIVAANGRIFEQDPVSGAFSEVTAGAHAATTRLVALAAPEPRRVLAVGDNGTILSVEAAP